MQRFSAVLEELQNCRNLVQQASAIIESVPVLQGANKEQVEALLQEITEELNATGVFVRACHT